ncbi:DUF3313 domain-containing protein [Pseudohalioglobus sediminis]|uniref:DUF3313 domain-containing protein n=1 Tax=Pseudohalioglobus sediminis TaxID=2606449 RepID=A0A5B0WR79_9GAMM|nr:DUF3313 family protein [Pseudohalioglobus sediminis]KAA1189604.1 DUF3313 domain-containing protein [Pseudohalioglobus sediminis]
MKGLYQFVAALAICLATPSVMADKLPDTTHDGLARVPDTKVEAVYMRPGADLGEYDKIAMLEAYVAFRKNWQRDQNRQAMTLSERISDEDMQKIRDALAQEFATIFADELVTKGGHTLVKEGGAGVLILRPAIVNLDIAAPDTMSAGRSRSYTTTSGQMTLYLELYDGLTGDIIARIVDPKAIDDGFIHYTNRVTNKADADRILRRWARLLNEHLAEVKSQDGKDG